MLSTFSLVGLAIAIFATFGVLEVLLRGLANRYGTPQVQR